MGSSKETTGSHNGSREVLICDANGDDRGVCGRTPLGGCGLCERAVKFLESVAAREGKGGERFHIGHDPDSISEGLLMILAQDEVEGKKSELKPVAGILSGKLLGGEDLVNILAASGVNLENLRCDN